MPALPLPWQTAAHQKYSFYTLTNTNQNLDATGGLDHYIHQLAGKELDVECRRIGKLKVGQACLTSGYKLCKYIIHTASPVWNIQNKNNEALLVITVSVKQIF